MFSDSKSPLIQLSLWRFREFWRRPEALFWTYGFPLIMLLGLGFAFRDAKALPLHVEVRGSNATEIIQKLEAAKTDLVVAEYDDDHWQKRLQSGRVNAVIESAGSLDSFVIWAEENRAESRTARWIVESTLRSKDASTQTQVEVKSLDVPGSRYIDFLVPGMMAMNLMGGGLWGVGFAIVDLRVRKLLKRLLATPMSKFHFMASLMIVRMVFAVCELTALILFSYFVFGVGCQGSLLELVAVLFIGGVSFVSIGLLIASRVQTIEAISGLMNLVMVPMWILGGIFFSNERFPEVVQPILRSLPVVALVDSLRAIMLDGRSILQLWQPITVMFIWTIVCFTIATRIFRWR